MRVSASVQNLQVQFVVAPTLIPCFNNCLKLSLFAWIDLAPAFDWNIKQLFVFVVAEYRSNSNPLNQVRIAIP
jgi:hypothetical protein